MAPCKPLLFLTHDRPGCTQVQVEKWVHPLRPTHQNSCSGCTHFSTHPPCFRVGGWPWPKRTLFPKPPSSFILHHQVRWYMHTSVVLCARVLKRTGGRLWVKPHLSPYPSENSKSAAYNQRVRADKAQAVTETLKRAEALESIQAHLPAPTIKPNGRQWAWKVLVRKLDKEKKLQKKHAPSGSFAASAVSKN